MDSLNDTNWDVLIAGTGLYQSLLALYVTDLAIYDKDWLTQSLKGIFEVEQENPPRR